METIEILVGDGGPDSRYITIPMDCYYCTQRDKCPGRKAREGAGMEDCCEEFELDYEHYCDCNDGSYEAEEAALERYYNKKYGLC